MPPTVLLIHGGAGTISPARLTRERRHAIIDGLNAALRAGQLHLVQGGSAVDAVIAAVSALEDDPNFNAGRGAVFTAAGTQEMDAAVMDGATRRIGAVAAICGPRNPVQAARLVMERSAHVLLVGAGAMEFLRAQSVRMEEPAYFSTPSRLAALRTVLEDRSAEAGMDDFSRHGTVGAVALDGEGKLAAATSTGGMTGTLPGRVGDSPIAGAGTWADETCAVSATGHGESFIRIAAAHEISARLRHAGQDLQGATSAVMASLRSVGGDGGLIALDGQGNLALPFISRGMYRGLAIGDEAPRTAIYEEALAS